MVLSPTKLMAVALLSGASAFQSTLPKTPLVHAARRAPLSSRRGAPTTSMFMAPGVGAPVDLDAAASAFSAATSMILSDESLPLGEFGGSYASLYATLALYVICFPGLYSQVKRSVKIDLKQKTYSMPGPAASDGARPLRQVAAEVMAYWQGNAYKVVEAGEVIVFKGNVEASKSNAFFLSFCTFVGTGTLALVLSNSPLNNIGPIEIGSWYYLMTLSAPFAGLYYWNNAPKEDEVRVRLQTTDDELETEVTVQAPKEKLEIFMRTMNYNEKGMVRVKGILPDQFI